MLNDGRSTRNTVDRRLEENVNTLLHKFDIKREEFFVGQLN